jgi:hypothetical protein
VPAELIARSEVEGIWELGAGPAFGSMRVEYAQELAASSLARVPAELRGRVLLFDWWIRNEDRNYTEQGGNPNLLWNIAEGQLVVFDHNLAFDEEFDAEQFRSGHAFRQHLSALSDPVFQAAEAARLHGALQHFDAILSEMPDVWLTGAVEGGQNFDIDSP